MELQQLPDAAEYFDFSARRFVGNTRRTLRQIPAHESFKSWELWVAQACAAVAKLHDAGFVHGAIDPSCFVITEDGNLRLGGLQKAHPKETVPPAEPFAPNNLVLPPEQNLYAAFQGAVSFQKAYDSLSQANWSMDQLETIFPAISFSRPVMFGLYEKVQSAPSYRDMQQAGDVWMLGFSLLSRYYEMLEWPYAIGTEFYETKHEVFHDFIERMVRVNPADRITVLEALKEWAPQEVPKTPTDVVVAVPAPAPEPVPAPAPTVSESVDFVETPVTAGSATAVKRRPYLTLQSHPAGRSRTRRNLRNSGPNSATGSSVLLTQG
jgi:serine/threonine protein kinase